MPRAGKSSLTFFMADGDLASEGLKFTVNKQNIVHPGAAPLDRAFCTIAEVLPTIIRQAHASDVEDLV
jgi:hypothetical protein